jgi:hypothetical protein
MRSHGSRRGFAAPHHEGGESGTGHRDAQAHRHHHRQDAEALSLCAQRSGRARLRSRIQAAADAAGDAEAWRVLRQVHDRLPQGIPGELVCAREAFAAGTRPRAQFLRRRRQPAALGLAQEGLGAACSGIAARAARRCRCSKQALRSDPDTAGQAGRPERARRGYCSAPARRTGTRSGPQSRGCPSRR